MASLLRIASSDEEPAPTRPRATSRGCAGGAGSTTPAVLVCPTNRHVTGSLV